MLEDVLEILEPIYNNGISVGIAHRLLGEIVLKDNLAQAMIHFDKSIAIFKEIEAENELALAYAGIGRLHKKQGQVLQAREWLSKAQEIFERLGTLIEPDRVREELKGLPKA
jgi:tetratricopeptide (TPR) repeat protein